MCVLLLPDTSGWLPQIDLDQPGGWNTIYLRQGSDLERR